MRSIRALLCALLTSTVILGSGELSGRRAPGFTLPDSQLKYYDLADYRGKVVLLEIMQSTCPDCQLLAKTLDKLKVRYAGKVVVLAVVNPPDNQTTVAKFLQESKITSPVLFDCGQMSASYFKANLQNSSMHVPHLFVIDTQGMIRNDFSKTPETKNLFEGMGLSELIDPLLTNQTTAPSKSTKK